MNPFKGPSPMKQLMDMTGQIRSLMNNPSQIADVLFRRGAVDQQTYENIKNMNPSQIGNYLIENGLLQRDQAQNVYQNMPKIRQMLGL